MLFALNAIVLGLEVALWLMLFSQPRRYIKGLFTLAPWLGLYVVMGAEWDFFKAGLVMSPLLWLWGPRMPALGRIRVALFAVAIIAVILLSWQLFSKEVQQYDILRTVNVDGRLSIATALFLLRLSLPFLICAFVKRPADIESCAGAYVNSVLVLCVYGLFQQAVFLMTGHPVTYVMRQGIFGDSTEVSSVQMFGWTLMRVHSFSKEPKDLALFCVPAIAWLWSQLGVRRMVVVKLVVILAASVLTFSSSFVLVFPAVVFVVEWMRHRRGIKRRPATYVFGALVLATFVPFYLSVSQVRVSERFNRAEDLLQVGRERPLYFFLADQFPRSLFGYGVGTQTSFLPGYMTREYWSKSLETREVVGVDSFAMTLFSDLGIEGLLLVLLAVLTAVRSKRVSLPTKSALAAVAIAGIPLNCDLRSGILWLFLGLAAAEARLSRPGPKMAMVSREVRWKRPEVADEVVRGGG